MRETALERPFETTDLLASICNAAVDGYVLVFQDGRVRLETKDKTLDFGFGE